MTLVQGGISRRIRAATFVVVVLGVVAGLVVLAPAASAAFRGFPGKIAFTNVGPPPPGSSRANFDVWVMDPHGSERTRLTDHPQMDHEPAFSPDAKRITFTSSRDQLPGFSPDHREIYVMNADGSGETRLTRTDPNVGTLSADPAFSPNGLRIAFARSTAGRQGPGRDGIYVMNADGSGQRNLTPSNDPLVEDRLPAFSPDGRRIAFSSIRPPHPKNYEIYIMNADGTGLTRLTHNATQDERNAGPDEYAPNFSPDGQWITYQREGSVFEREGSVFKMKVDGSQQTQLTRPPLSTDHPSFSPDGTRIAFGVTQTQAFERGVENGIFLMRADGSDQRRISKDVDSDPDWGVGTPERCGGKQQTLFKAGAAQNGTVGPLVIRGTSGRDVIVGTDGPDKIKGGGGKDIICAGKGNDRVSGGGGNDKINGEKGKDRLKGGKGRDRIKGGKGRDRINGGSGRDSCVGGPGRDVDRSCELI